MFDIGFWELAIIGVVALLVVGPERLPKLARTAGMWVGRARGFVSNVKADIDRELKADELKKAIERNVQNTGLHEFADEVRDTASLKEELELLSGSDDGAESRGGTSDRNPQSGASALQSPGDSKPQTGADTREEMGESNPQSGADTRNDER